ncbi:unnamed protein product [Pleuronectes platessa]|uniref:Uncharacterized protein n=1 Tax=Pleuronectes platessa TaxID=8262 RepID=A0A9N7VBS4_PLEPL|nr:unnamed protein product [Pleuronectes platessa]
MCVRREGWGCVFVENTQSVGSASTLQKSLSVTVHRFLLKQAGKVGARWFLVSDRDDSGSSCSEQTCLFQVDDRMTMKEPELLCRDVLLGEIFSSCAALWKLLV